MSAKALGMLKHMRRQILGQPAPYVVVRGAAISIGVDPGGSECHALVEELLRIADTKEREAEAAILWKETELLARLLIERLRGGGE